MEVAPLSQNICRHCGLQFSAPSPSIEFCCTGCEFVSGLIRSEGLDEYYRLREANPPDCALPAKVSTESYEFCDDPEFIKRASSDGLRLTFYLEGLSCSACIWLIEKLPDLCPDAQAVVVNMSASAIDVWRVPGESFAAIARTLNRLGYSPHPVLDSENIKELKRKERRRDMVRIGLAGAATGNIMILAVSLYAGAEGAIGSQFRWMSALLAAPVLSYGAWPFYKSAFGALRARSLNIDVPIVAALIAGIVIGLYGLAAGIDTVYFDSLSMLVFLLLSSRFWLKSVQQEHLDTSHLEDELLFGTVVRIPPEGGTEKVSTISLKAGDRIEISGDMNIPVDGRVVSGGGFFHIAALTGETDALEVSLGREVEAGSRNLSGHWILEVSRPAAESRLAAILRDTETSARSKPKIVLFADRVSHWFVMLVLGLALGVALFFLKTNPQEGFTRALALVIVTCPCVFGMAIPLSMSLGIRAAARRGLVIKDADVLERLLSIRHLIFDKTGTLTSGEMRVLSIEIDDADRDHLKAVAMLENGLSHPVARTLLKAVKDLGYTPAEAGATQEVRTLPTGGVSGVVDGRLYSIRPIDSRMERKVEKQIRARYELVMDMAEEEEKRLAVFEIGDELREGAAELVRWAHRKGLRPQVLSGDRRAVVEDCAAKLSLNSSEFIAEATPEAKSQYIKKFGPRAAMVGDGANDAGALASSAVGIAVRGSMDISLKAADVYLMRTDLRVLPELFDIAHGTRKAIVRNLVFSASFNIVSGALAVLGFMTPLFAAVLMPLSSFIVLISALVTGKRLSLSNRRSR